MILKRRHQRCKALDRAAVIFDEYVPEIRRLHLFSFHSRMPPHRRILVIHAAGCLDDAKASPEVIFAELV